jgi:hypothetical protein
MSGIEQARDALVAYLPTKIKGRVLVAAFEAAVRADQRERDARLAAGISFLDGRPDAEGDALAESIRRHPFPGDVYPDPVRKAESRRG